MSRPYMKVMTDRYASRHGGSFHSFVSDVVESEHQPEKTPDWVQSEKIRKAQEKRDRKRKARGGMNE